MYKITFFVPTDHKEKVKNAVFSAGGGRIGNYDHCCWEVKGTGQFKPLAGANPYLGKVESIESVEEFRVELVCNESLIEDVVAALIAAHPYEEPAYDIIALTTL
ncbi:NGG1p interacting factor NIF3 [Gammaproteobacteria bacterium 45_16_T64]|nr:NGG1p interacting factor NIF3 [Gammaproteobacteria bacterium 45_16_T64]